MNKTALVAFSLQWVMYLTQNDYSLYTRFSFLVILIIPIFSNITRWFVEVGVTLLIPITYDN